MQTNARNGAQLLLLESYGTVRTKLYGLRIELLQGSLYILCHHLLIGLPCESMRHSSESIGHCRDDAVIDELLHPTGIAEVLGVLLHHGLYATPQFHASLLCQHVLLLLELAVSNQHQFIDSIVDKLELIRETPHKARIH